jgi:hypothetical protein
MRAKRNLSKLGELKKQKTKTCATGEEWLLRWGDAGAARVSVTQPRLIDSGAKTIRFLRG